MIHARVSRFRLGVQKSYPGTCNTKRALGGGGSRRAVWFETRWLRVSGCPRAGDAQESWVIPAERNDPSNLIRVIPAQEAALRALDSQWRKSMTKHHEAAMKRERADELTEERSRRGVGLLALIAILTILGIAVWLVVSSSGESS